MKKGTVRNSMLLFLAACIWGVAFVSQQVGMDYMGPFTFNGVRSLLGAAALLPLLAVRSRNNRKKEQRSGEKAEKPNWSMYMTAGICCGLALTGGSSFQQLGLVHTTVGKAGFITTLYIIIVPLIGIFLHKKVQAQIWIGALAAAAGLYLLCVNESFSINKGDGLVFCGAVIFSLHILIIDYYSPKVDGVILSCMQFLVCGIVCMAAAFLLENPQISQIKEGIVPILYAGIMSCGVAYTLQIIGQKNMNPTVAALILSMESVVSVLAGWFLLEQKLSFRVLTGCVIVFAAVVFVQIPFSHRKREILSQKSDTEEA